MGCSGAAGPSTNLIYLLNFGFIAINTSDTIATSVVGQNGLFLNSRTTLTNTIQYKNATALTTSAQTSTGISTTQIYIGAYNNNGTTAFFSNNETAFSSIGNGLNATEEGNFYTAVQTFNTTLSRQV
jgi:hypothetical protein